MRGLGVALALPALLACRSFPATVEVERDASYTHVATGFAFPQNVAAFERSGITQYDEGAFNVSATYLLGAPIDMFATVYHYPATADLHRPSPQELDAHFEQVQAEILAYSPGGRLESAGVRPFQINGFRLPARFAYYYLPNFHGEGTAMQSRLYLFALDGWYLKFRFSTQEPIELAEEEIDDFICAFKWPRPDAPSSP